MADNTHMSMRYSILLCFCVVQARDNKHPNSLFPHYRLKLGLQQLNETSVQDKLTAHTVQAGFITHLAKNTFGFEFLVRQPVKLVNVL